MQETNPHLLCFDANGVRSLTLNRPERRNAMNCALAEALLTALRQANSDPSIGAILLAGNGSVFCAGADLGEFKGELFDANAEARRSDIFVDLQLVFDELDLPVVCALEGAAIGAGASLAISADITVMGQEARLAYPEILHSMVPGLMIAQLQRRTGRKLAFELLALGQSMDAQAALVSGLANRVVTAGQASAIGSEIAATLASRSRAAMRETKRLFVDHAQASPREALLAARRAARDRIDRVGK